MADYTPSTTFDFGSASSYTPSTDFEWVDTATDPEGNISVTLTGLSGTFDALNAQFGTIQALSLDDVTGTFVGDVPPQGVITATLDDLSGELSAINVPQGNILSTLDDLSGSISGYIYQNRGVIDATLDDVSGEFSAINAPQGNILATLDDLSGDFIGSNRIEGHILATLDDVVGELIGNLPVKGDLDGTLEDLIGAFTAEIPTIGRIDVILENLSGELLARNIQNLGQQQNTTLAGVVGGIIGNYDVNVPSLLIIKTYSPSESTTKLLYSKVESLLQQAIITNIQTESPQQDGTQLTLINCFVMEDGTKFNFQIESTHETATYLNYLTCMPVEQGTRHDFSKEVVYEQAIFADSYFGVVMEQMTKVYPYRWESVHEGADVQYDFVHPVMRDPLPPWDYTPDWDNADADFVDNGFTPDGNFEFNFGIPDSLALEHKFGIYFVEFNSGLDEATINNKQSCVIVEEGSQPPRGKTPWVDLPLPPVDPNPPNGGDTYTVPTQEVYTMQNTLLVTLDDDLTEIHMSTVSLSLDRDSYTWQFSGDLLDPDQIALVKQVAGVSVILHITINGEVWHVLVEKISTNRTFGNKAVSISGRGLTALIGKPYVQPTSANYGTTLGIQEIVALMKPLGWNDLGATYWLMGFENVDLQTGTQLDYQVDGGAYSYSGKTPIEALSELVQNLGGFILPSRDSQEYFFRDCYTVLPWNFATVDVDVVIPDAAIIALTEEPVASWQGQGVYIHGNEIGGELALVRLNGVADPRLVPTASNGLMTDGVALRSLGRRILAAQAEQPIIKSVTTFMDGTIVPFINVGTYIGFDVDGVEIRGIVNGVSITATHAEVSQTLTIGEQTPNTWAAFKDLIPIDPIVIGEISSTDGITSLMLLVDGSSIRVRGTGNVGGKYWIDSQHIIDSAPNMVALVDITV